MLDHDPSLEANDLASRRTAADRPPIDLNFILRPIPNAAAGLPAVLHSFEYALKNAGPGGTAQTFLAINQRNGFDCPSCAWADPEEKRSLVEFCENGAKALSDAATQDVLRPDFFARYSINELGAQSDQWLNAAGRLSEPMVLLPGATHYTPIGWDAAFELVARELNALQDPNEAVFYTSGKASNEAAFLYQLFVRMFGTNNLPDCSNLCHESSGAAIKESLGVAKATVTLGDLEHAKCILVIGQNPGTNHPRMLTSLQTAKRNGATIIAINPLPEVGLMRFKHPQEPLAMLGRGTALTDHFVQVRINGDAALFKGILKAMFARETRTGDVLDRSFIADYTSGLSSLVDDIDRAHWTTIETQSGVSRARIEEIADVIAAAPSVVACWAMGLTQHPNSVATIRELINILLLGGNVGRPGAGVFPVRGHSNVQGDRTMGVWERIDDAFLDRLGAEFGFEPPREHGYDAVKAIHAMAAGRVGVFVSLGGNFLSATPATDDVARGLRRTKLSVCISTKLNRGHLITGSTALILPCITRTEIDLQAGGEQFVTVENTISVVSRSRGGMPPVAPALKSEPAIVAGIAAATLRGKHTLDWDALVADYDRIRDRIARVVIGFDDFNARIASDDIFYAPVPAKERNFKATSTGKARFTVNALPSVTLGANQYVMMTLRSHDQFNTVIYGADDRYRGVIGGRRVIFMNALDMRDAGLADRQLVDITSHFAGQTRTVEKFAVIPYDIPRRSTATYYPETNPIVPLGSVAEISNTPTSKFVIITLQPSHAA